MSMIEFKRDVIERWNRPAKCLLVNRIVRQEPDADAKSKGYKSAMLTTTIAAIYKAERSTEHPDAPCWVLEHKNGRRDIHDTQSSAKDDALKLAI